MGIGLVGLGGIAKSHLTALKIAEDEGFARCVAAADLFEDVRNPTARSGIFPRSTKSTTSFLKTQM